MTRGVGIQSFGRKHLRLLRDDEHGMELGAVISGQLKAFFLVVFVDTDRETLCQVRTIANLQEQKRYDYLESLGSVEACICAYFLPTRI